MRLRNNLYILLAILAIFVSCKKKPKTVETPWGGNVTIDGSEITDSASTTSGNSLDEIQQNEELIMLTVYGPDTYYDYHGHSMGIQYQICENFAEHINVHLRVDVCRDTVEMLQHLRNGEGDIIAVPLSSKHQKGFIVVADNWVVGKNSQALAAEVNKWYNPKMLLDAKKKEQYRLSVASVTRHVYPWMLSASKGQISNYDSFFQQYAYVAMVDWTLMAAQCYQESCFDPKAHSWAGACGLMQIMPATADHLGLAREMMYDPEANISASARYMRELQELFKDINDPRQRMAFALASYNGGYYHVRDAMALARKYGGSPQRWSDVRRYILLLEQPRYYNDPVVKHGYVRGTETVGYVDIILERQQQYRLALATGKQVSSVVKTYKGSNVVSLPAIPMEATPHRAARKNKWRKD